MKNKLLIIILLAGTVLKAQIVISDTPVSQTSSPSVVLEFGQGNKGLILPYIEDNSNITEPGSLIFDANDKKVKLRTNGSWKDLTVAEDGQVDLVPQNGKIENPSAGVKIGISNQNQADGIFVLEDNDKAMVLPHAAYDKVENPASGMMIYDPGIKMICIYNGANWTFWAASSN